MVARKTVAMLGVLVHGEFNGLQSALHGGAQLALRGAIFRRARGTPTERHHKAARQKDKATAWHDELSLGS
jgi:hypothetical protein